MTQVRVAILLTLFMVARVHVATCAMSPVEMEEEPAAVAQGPWILGGASGPGMWGTFRPGVLWGLRSRHPQAPPGTGSALVGIAWAQPWTADLQHQAVETDDPYGWETHDASSYGRHGVTNRAMGLNVTCTWVSSDAEATQWWARIGAHNLDPDHVQPVAMYAYVVLEQGELENGPAQPPPVSFATAGADTIRLSGTYPHEADGTWVAWINHTRRGHPLEYTPAVRRALAASSIALPPLDAPLPSWVGVRVHGDQAWNVEAVIKSALASDFQDRVRPTQQAVQAVEGNRNKTPFIPPMLPNRMEPGANVVVMQWIMYPPFDIDVTWITKAAQLKGLKAKKWVRSRRKAMQGEHALSLAHTRDVAWRKRFDATFRIEEDSHRHMAHHVLSNLLGGIGWWSGTALEAVNDTSTLVTGPHTLLSAVPSRSFFPRGFLWDEGFHQLLVQQWDPNLTLEVLASWLALQRDDGWIPREQILGSEARARVPREFQAQHRAHANPPTLLLAVDRLMRTRAHDAGEAAHLAQWLHRWLPHLDRWVAWLQRTQGSPAVAAAHVPNLGHDVALAYRWAGRTPNHTLASGLDDYPRAAEPNERELHLDLHCWMTTAYGVVSRAHAFVVRHWQGAVPDAQAHTAAAEAGAAAAQLLKASLGSVHWDVVSLQYADVADFVRTGRGEDGGDVVQGTAFVRHRGYVTLFPLATCLLEPGSQRLARTLDWLVSPASGMWTTWGLRSLSALDPLYGSGENYWRGAVWINVNYLVLSALHRCYMQPVAARSPVADKAADVYHRLRRNIVTNMEREWLRSGFVFEQYDANSGKGIKSRPFTGWSSLVVAIMAESY